MARRVFTDADELAALVRACDAQMWIRGPSPSPSSLDVVNVGDIELHSIHLTPPMTAAIRVSPNLVRMSIPIARKGDWTIQGRPFDVGKVLLAGPGDQYVAASEAAVDFIVVYIPVQRFLDRRYTLGRHEAPIGTPCGIFTPDPQALRAAQSAICTAYSFASRCPELAAKPAANRVALGPLLDSLVRITTPDIAAGEGALRFPGHIVRQLEEFMDAHEDEPLCVSDLCGVASASERTLRNVFNKIYGTSPARYLRLRRLNQAHRALRQRETGEVRVTDVAMRYGFLDVGRFAAEYRQTFGEYPSATLRRA
jgi:AraC-like DNA-binding protein